MVFCALLATLSGALLVYVSHPQQRLVRAAPPMSIRMMGCPLLFAGILAWCHASGIGAGMASALSTAMATWVLLPYFAWWRGKAMVVRAGKR